jgi:phage protein D
MLLRNPHLASDVLLLRAGTSPATMGWSITMADTKSTRGRAQDRAKVASGQEHEVRYEAGKTGSSASEVKSAVKSAGNSRSKVEAKLKGGK